MTRQVKVFDENGRPSERWDRFDTLFAYLVQHKRALKKHPDAFGSFFTLVKWEQLISGVVCMTLPSNELLNTSDTTRICMDALHQCAESEESDLTRARQLFQRLCEHRIKTLVEQGEKAYLLHTAVSLPASATGTFTYRDSVLTLPPPNDPGPMMPALLQDAIHADIAKKWTQCKYRRIQVAVTALTPDEAIRKGLRAVNLVRAVVTLRRGKGTQSIQLMGRREAPLALIHLGPLHLLAERESQTCVNDAWAEELYTEDWPLFKDSKDWLDIAADVQAVLNRVSELPYSLPMEDLLCRYVSALDETRWSVTLLQLWSLVEKITDTVGHNQKQLVPRASRVFPDGSLARDVLETIRCTRNRVVHSGHADGINERWASELRLTAESHLDHLLCNTFDVDSTEEYATLLGLPRESSVLCRDIALRRSMMGFQDRFR
jgi:hypothetical protein